MIRWVLAVAALAVAVAGCSNAVPGPSPQGQGAAPSVAVSAPAVASSAPSVAAAVGFVTGEGESLVPDQVLPGTWQSAGPTGTSACYAAAYDKENHVAESSISRGQAILVVPSNAARVKARGCQPFAKVR